MKHILLYLLLFSATIGHAQPYDDIMSDWCRVQLKGKVKEIVKSYHPNNPEKVGYKTLEYITKVSTDGYVIETSTQIDGKRTSSLQYKYGSNNNKDAAYTIEGQKTVVIKKDKIVRNVLDSFFNETSIDTINMLVLSRSNTNSAYYNFRQRQYIYNKHKQITRVFTSVKYNLLLNRKKYIYNELQQLIKTVDKPFLTKHTITKYKVLKTDSIGNHTKRQIIVRTRLKHNTYIENTTYTYYD